jgi:general secretion pathway protein I
MRRWSKPAPKAARGFTLLEAIVALTLVAGVGLALFGWVNTARITLLRVQDASARQEATSGALEFLKLVNPMLQPNGETQLGRVRLTWRAEPLTPVQQGQGFPQGSSLYALALYRTRVTLDREGEPGWHQFEVKQVGYRRVVDPITLMPGG